MSEMAELQERVAVLEKQVDQLLHGERATSWRQSIGVFAGDKVMKEIFEEGQKVREEDRQKSITELDALGADN